MPFFVPGTAQGHPEALRRNVVKDELESPLDHGQLLALHAALQDGLVIGTPKDRQGTAAHHQGDHEEVLMRLTGPVNGHTDTPGARHVPECLATKPFGTILRLESVVV